MPPFYTQSLANGLTLEFFDCSNRYFGAYWRVCLEARCPVPLSAAGLAAAEMERARRLLGETVEFTRRLERMGVSEEEVAAVRQALIASFLASARAYLESPAFPARLIAGRLAEKRLPRRFSIVRNEP
ncbi:MAG: hypothetical protein WDA20_08390 [Desulfuromonadales bacterium]